MIKCKAILQIHGSNSAASSSDKWLCVDFSLPHFPVMGMTLDIKEELSIELIDRPRYEGGCCHLHFDVETQLLKIYVEDMRAHSSDGGVMAAVKAYRKLGWKTYEG